MPASYECSFTEQQLQQWHELLQNNCEAKNVASHMDSQVRRFGFMIGQLKTKELPLNLTQYLQVQGKELQSVLMREGLSKEEASELALAKMNSIAKAVGVSDQVFEQIEDVLTMHRARYQNSLNRGGESHIY